jgi:hypothetical protein
MQQSVQGLKVGVGDHYHQEVFETEAGLLGLNLANTAVNSQLEQS